MCVVTVVVVTAVIVVLPLCEKCLDRFSENVTLYLISSPFTEAEKSLLKLTPVPSVCRPAVPLSSLPAGPRSSGKEGA